MFKFSATLLACCLHLAVAQQRPPAGQQQQQQQQGAGSSNDAASLPMMQPMIPESTVDVQLTGPALNELGQITLKPGQSLSAALAKVSIKATIRNGTINNTVDGAFPSVVVYLTRFAAPDLPLNDSSTKLFWSPETVYIGEESLKGMTKGDSKALNMNAYTLSFDNEPALCGEALLVWRFDPFGISGDYNATNHTIAINVTVDCSAIQDKVKAKRFVEIIPDFQAAGHKAAVMVYNGGQLRRGLVYMGFPGNDWGNLDEVADIPHLAYIGRMRLLIGRMRRAGQGNEQDSCLFDRPKTRQDTATLKQLADSLESVHGKLVPKQQNSNRANERRLRRQAGTAGTTPQTPGGNMQMNGTDQMPPPNVADMIPQELKTLIRFLRLVANEDSRLNDALFKSIDAAAFTQVKRIASAVTRIARNKKAFTTFFGGSLDDSNCWAPQLNMFLTQSYQLYSSLRFPIKAKDYTGVADANDRAVGRALCFVAKTIAPLPNDLLIDTQAVQNWQQQLGLGIFAQMAVDAQFGSLNNVGDNNSKTRNRRQTASSNMRVSSSGNRVSTSVNIDSPFGGASISFSSSGGADLDARKLLGSDMTNLNTGMASSINLGTGFNGAGSISTGMSQQGSNQLNAIASMGTQGVQLTNARSTNTVSSSIQGNSQAGSGSLDRQTLSGSLDRQAGSGNLDRQTVSGSLDRQAGSGSLDRQASSQSASVQGSVNGAAQAGAANPRSQSTGGNQNVMSTSNTGTCNLDFNMLDTSTSSPFQLYWIERNGKIYQGMRLPTALANNMDVNWRPVASLSCVDQTCDANGGDDWDVDLDTDFDDDDGDDDDDDMNAPLAGFDSGSSGDNRGGSSVNSILRDIKITNKMTRRRSQMNMMAGSNRNSGDQRGAQNTNGGSDEDDMDLGIFFDTDIDASDDQPNTDGRQAGNNNGNSRDGRQGGNNNRQRNQQRTQTVVNYQIYYINNYNYMGSNMNMGMGGQGQGQQNGNAMRPIYAQRQRSRSNAVVKQQIYNVYSISSSNIVNNFNTLVGPQGGSGSGMPNSGNNVNIGQLFGQGSGSGSGAGINVNMFGSRSSNGLAGFMNTGSIGGSATNGDVDNTGSGNSNRNGNGNNGNAWGLVRNNASRSTGAGQSTDRTTPRSNNGNGGSGNNDNQRQSTPTSSSEGSSRAGASTTSPSSSASRQSTSDGSRASTLSNSNSNNNQGSSSRSTNSVGSSQSMSTQRSTNGNQGSNNVQSSTQSSQSSARQSSAQTTPTSGGGQSSAQSTPTSGGGQSSAQTTPSQSTASSARSSNSNSGASTPSNQGNSQPSTSRGSSASASPSSSTASTSRQTQSSTTKKSSDGNSKEKTDDNDKTKTTRSSNSGGQSAATTTKKSSDGNSKEKDSDSDDKSKNKTKSASDGKSSEKTSTRSSSAGSNSATSTKKSGDGKSSEKTSTSSRNSASTTTSTTTTTTRSSTSTTSTRTTTTTTKASLASTSAKQDSPPATWSSDKSVCYDSTNRSGKFFVLTGAWNWTQAGQACQAKKARLAVVLSLEDQSVVIPHLNKSIAWNCNGYWIALKHTKLTNGSYYYYWDTLGWNVNLGVPYTRWETNTTITGGLPEPDHKGCGGTVTEWCTRIAPAQGTWDDIECFRSTTMNGALCQRPNCNGTWD